MSATQTHKNNLTKLEAAGRAGFISNVSYDIHLDLTSSDETFISDVAIRFDASTPGATTFLDLLAKSAEVQLNGVSLKDAFDGERIQLQGLAATNEVRVKAICEYQKTGVGFHRFVDPVDSNPYLYTDFEPFEAHRAFACFDQPDIKGVFDFSVTAPAGWEVISNTKPVARPAPGGDGVWKFAPTPRLSTYVTAVIAGPYHVVRDAYRGTELGIYCRQSLARHLDPDEIFEITKAGLEFFNEEFDYPYMLDKYDQIFVPEYNQGAMENFGAITVNELYIFRSKVTDTARERRGETILHEMAHMWFGDLVTMRWWEDLWLNESFATYEAMIAQNAATRFKTGWTTFANNWKTWAYQQDQLPTTHPITTGMVDTDSVHVNFDGISYAKGCSVLRQLVAWVGEKEYREGLRTYFKRHEYGNAELKDFLACLEETSGRDLKSWSREWLEAAGVNSVKADFTSSETSGNEVIESFTIVQEAPPEHPTLRSHRIGVGLYDLVDAKLSLRKSVEVDISGAASQVPPLEGDRVPDLILLNDGDLTFTKIRLDPRSLRTVIDHISDFDESLPRALCWAAAWDMTRDAEMGARDYLDMIIKHAPLEEQISVVDSLGLEAMIALGRFVHPQNRVSAYASFSDGSLAIARAAAPGTDAQLSWARLFAATARTSEQLAIVEGLLDGTYELPGLAIDTDLRWTLVTLLSAASSENAHLIDIELERDPTDAGERRALTARAMIPDPKNKQKVFKSIVGDKDLPLAKIRALVAGFYGNATQVELAEPYLQKYFDSIDKVASRDSMEITRTFVAGMYPDILADDATIAATDAYLAAHDDLTTYIKRPILEHRDSVLRAMRAQQKDLA